MSGLSPFEGSGESLDLLTPLEPTTTITSYQVSTTTNTDVTTTVTTTTAYTISATQDHQSKSVPFLLPLWAWAAVLVGITVLLSVILIWITLVVGWKKRKKKRDYQVNVNPSLRPSRRNSNLWIDEYDGRGQSVEGTSTSNRTTATRLPEGSSSVSTGYPNASYTRQHNDILKEMKAKSSVFLNEHNRGTRGDRERHHDRPHSQTLPRSRQVNSNVTDVRLNHRLIHLQPATTSTFKRRTGQAHSHNREHNDTHSNPAHNPNPVDTATCCNTLERKFDISDSEVFEMNPFNYHSNPVDQAPPTRGLELSGNVQGPQINDNPLPPRLNYNFDNYFDELAVTTFSDSQYAFNTL